MKPLARIGLVAAVPVLLGGSLALTATAPARADTWADTGLQITHLHSTCASAPTTADVPVAGQGGVLTAATTSDTLSANESSGLLAVPGSHLGKATLTFSGKTDAAVPPALSVPIVVDVGNGSGCTVAFVFSVPPAFTILPSTPPVFFGSTAPGFDSAAISGPSYVPGAVQVTGTSTGTNLPLPSGVAVPAANSGTFKYTLGTPAGSIVINGRQLVIAGSTAPPNTYTSNGVTYTDSLGAVASDAFQLVVSANPVVTPPPPGNLGDEVNGFGNGFDVFRQHWVAGSIVVGWTATKGDPATHFVRISRGAGVWQFEAVNGHGIATGLCVSDPGGGWPDPAGPNGLLITPCNSGPFQQFKVLTAEPSELRNVATGLVVWPDGTGAQLRGSATPIPGVDNHYTWKQLADLP